MSSRAFCTFVRRFLVALGVVAALFAVAETVARATWDQPVKPWLGHPLFQVVRARSYGKGRVDADEPEKRFDYEVNAFGLRGRNLRTLEKPAGAYRIFFVGGSTTENSSTPEELTFAGLVESELRARGNPLVEVGNAGIIGGRTAHTLAQLSVRLPPLSPDLYVVLDGLNDLLDSLRDPFDPTTYDLAYAPRTTLGDWLFDASRLYATWEVRRGTYAERNVLGTFRHRARIRATEPKVPFPRDPAWNVAAFEAALRRIAAIAAADRVALALMTQPTLYKAPMPPEDEAVTWVAAQNGMNVPTEQLLAGMRAYNDAIRRVARDSRAILVDLDRAVPKDREHFFDDAHLTRKGNAAVGRAVLEAILQDGKLPRS